MVVTVLVGCTSVSSAAEIFALLVMRVPLATPALTCARKVMRRLLSPVGGMVPTLRPATMAERPETSGTSTSSSSVEPAM